MSILNFFKKNKKEDKSEQNSFIDSNEGQFINYQVRNNLKDATFYTNGIKLMNKKALKPIEMFEEYKRKKPDATRTKVSYFMEASALLASFQMKYCRGDSFKNLKKEYSSIFDLYIKSFDQSSIYTRTLDILSLGILFDVPKILFEDFNKEMKGNNVQDFIFSSIINSVLHDVKVSDKLIFKKDKVCIQLRKIIQSDSDQAIVLINDLFANDWYTKANLGDAYNSHKGEGDIFLGYYAWSVAAIVKIKNIDDSSFKDSPYYPADLVHWKG